ncbi:MAG: hypothetical protein OQL19_18700 [Gammaproteobacteria bacterium]|nr:hypothetical protein [Gammaproteobacteria bacterium]
MNEETPLSIQVSPKQLDSFCKKIISRSRNISNTHEALNVLEAFLSSFSIDSQGADNYINVQQALKDHSTVTRKKLMVEKTEQLVGGFVTQNIQLLADVYGALSRNGFYQILTTATNQISRDQIPDISNWVISWAEKSKKLAEEASGYPDALDFKKANINIKHYQTMADIAYFFKNTYK